MAAKTPQQKRATHKSHYRRGTDERLQRVKHITNGKVRFRWYGNGVLVPDKEVETR
ncbi:MAG: hypothetical protein V3U11_13450 [Planctomycetota bacterium]